MKGTTVNTQIKFFNLDMYRSAVEIESFIDSINVKKFGKEVVL